MRVGLFWLPNIHVLFIYMFFDKSSFSPVEILLWAWISPSLVLDSNNKVKSKLNQGQVQFQSRFAQKETERYLFTPVLFENAQFLQIFEIMLRYKDGSKDSSKGN